MLTALEVLGVLAFAASGIIEAARKKLDVFGVVLIAGIAAFGGGTIRDLLLGKTTFFWMQNEQWVWLIIGVGVITPLFF